jgi:hypothetical protein
MKLIQKHHNLFIINVLISLIMRKQFFKLFAISAIVGIVFTGCQKESELAEPTSQSKIVPYSEININYVPNYKKDMIITDEGSATDRYGNVYRTLIIGNQEWLLLDMYATRTLFADKKAYPGDVTTTVNYGINHGAFYRLASVIDGTTQTQWNYLFNNNPSYAGYHVPTPSELNVLIQNLGTFEFVPEYLELQPDGYYNNAYWAEPETRCFWINDNGNPNRVAGCGVLIKFTPDNNLWYAFTNIPKLYANVRLVRSI